MEEELAQLKEMEKADVVCKEITKLETELKKKEAAAIEANWKIESKHRKNDYIRKKLDKGQLPTAKASGFCCVR